MAEPTITADGNDTFECAVRSDERLSNDFREWPEMYRKSTDAAIERLLADHPGATVVSDTSVCIDGSDPRFPDDAEHDGKFFAIRTVKLDVAETSEEISARDRLRAFEDAHLGDDVERHNGIVERGSGSKFSNLSPEHRAHHAAIEALIAAEAEHMKASTAEESAHAKLEAAIKRVNDTEEAL